MFDAAQNTTVKKMFFHKPKNLQNYVIEQLTQSNWWSICCITNQLHGRYRKPIAACNLLEKLHKGHN